MVTGGLNLKLTDDGENVFVYVCKPGESNKIQWSSL